MMGRIFATVISVALVMGWWAVEKSEEQAIHHQDADIKSEELAFGNEAAFSYPDEWVQTQMEMRTAKGDSIPRYKMGYQWDEFRKMQIASRGAVQKRLDWVERGPGNVPGRTRAIVVDPRDSSGETWLAGSVSGGIWKTIDGGDNWISMTDDFPQLAISTMALAKSNPDVIYAGTGEIGFRNLGAVSGNGILKSVDGGNSWSQLASTTRDNGFVGINRLAVDPQNENVILAATTTGIYRSTDGGSSFSRVFDGGNFQDLKSDPGNFNRLYAAALGQGVYKSDDAGQTWLDIGASFVDADRIELAVSPSSPSHVYAAVYVDPASGSSSSALYQSTDFGETFAEVGGNSDAPDNWLGSQGWYDNTIMVHPFNQNIVFVGGIQLFRIAVLDNGETTTGIKRIVQDNTASFLSFVNFTAPYLGGGLDLGTNNDAIGVTESDFVSVEVRFGPGLSQKAHRFSAPDGSGVPASDYVYEDYSEVPFQVWDVTNNKQIMVSYRDQVNDGAFNLIERDDDDNVLGREYLFVQAIDYDPDNPDIRVATSGGHSFKQIYFTWPTLTPGSIWAPNDLPESKLLIDWGDSFKPFWSHTNVSSGDDVHVDNHFLEAIIVDAGAETFEILNGNDGGVGLSTDGNTWFTKSGGYNTSQFYGADKSPTEHKYVAGAQDNGSWVSPVNPQSDTSWNFEIGGDGFESIWSQANPDLLMAGFQYNGLRRSTNGGSSFTSMPSLGDTGRGNAGFVTRIDRSRQDGELVFTTSANGIWKTDNWGDEWQLRPRIGWSARSWAQARISLADPQIVWAYGRPPSLVPGDDPEAELFLSEDGGESFRRIDISADSFPSNTITKIATHPRDPNTVYLAYSVFNRSKIFKSTNLASSWEELSGFGSGEESSNGFPDVAVLSLLVLPHAENTIWAGTEIGIYVSEDNGASWSYSNFGLPAVAIWDMKTSGDEVVVATYGRGLWTLTIPELLNAPPPTVTLAPQFADFNHNTDGNLATVISRSEYDSLQVWVNETSYHTATNNSIGESSISFDLPVSIGGEVPIRLVAFRNGRSYKSMPIRSTVTVGTPTENEQPNYDSFSLLPNYPNPFSGSTTIEFTSPSRAAVNLEVYSIDGRLVKSTVTKVYDSGKHSIEWKPQLLANGKYLVLLERDGERLSQIVSYSRR